MTMLQEFRAFLASKDPDDEYDYGNSRNCAAAQFMRSIGEKYHVAKADSHGDDYEKIEFVACQAAPGRWTTFGQALACYDEYFGE